MLSTIWRFLASSANSLGVQWLIGRPLSSGFSQEIAIIRAICSGVNFAGVPARYSSLGISSIMLPTSR
jgi:hypothetical protein